MKAAPFGGDDISSEATSHVHAQKIESVIRLARGNIILDAGCGDGRVSAALSRHGFSVIGCDRSFRQALSSKVRGKKAATNVETCVASLTHLPFRTSTFGTVCCLDVLEHISEIGDAIVELRRVVETGGTVIVVVPALAHGLIYDKILLRIAISRFILGKLGRLDDIEEGHFHIHTMTPSMVRARLERAGLQINSFLNVSFLSTYLETVRNVLMFLHHQSSRSFDHVIDLDLRIARYLPLALGSSWLITLRRQDRSV